jgi:hypothetical protein
VDLFLALIRMASDGAFREARYGSVVDRVFTNFCALWVQ